MNKIFNINHNITRLPVALNKGWARYLLPYIRLFYRQDNQICRCKHYIYLVLLYFIKKRVKTLGLINNEVNNCFFSAQNKKMPPILLV